MELSRFCRFWESKTGRGALLAFIGLAVAFTVISGTERALQGSSEFMGFRRIVQVSMVYREDHYQEIEHVRAYPPFFAVAWSPFGLLPVGVVPDKDQPLVNTPLGRRIQLAASAFVVLAFMTLLTLWSARLLSATNLEESEADGRRTCATALIWVLAGGLMINSIVRAETDMFVVFLVAAAMYHIFARRQDGVGGFLLGVAAAFKLTPGLFGVYLLCRRRWRAAAGMVAGGVFCAAVLPTLIWGVQGNWRRHNSWLHNVMLPYAQEGPEAFIGHAYRGTNQSLKAAVVRYLTPYNAGSSRHPRQVNVVEWSREGADKVAMGLKVLILGALLGAWLLVPRRRAELGPILFALVPPGMILLSDVSVGGHFAILIVPFAVLVGLSFRHRGRPLGRRAGWIAMIGFLLASLIAVQWLKEVSVGTAGALFLLVGLLWLAVKVYRAGEGELSPRAA